MFQTVGHWWSGERGKATVRLFAFEFLVVMAGVFAAQALAEWAAHTRALIAMEAAKEKADRNVAFHYAVAVGWKRAVPCLNDRMTLLMQQLNSSQSIDPALLKRPAMEGGNLQLPSQDQRQLLAERYGEDQEQDYWAASQNVTKLGNQVTEIVAAWSGFALVDTANGPPDSLDRHEARLAAGKVKAALRALDINANSIIGRARAVGVEPDSQGEFRLIRDCDDMWRNGMTHPNPEME